ncbi:hypothetical protein Tco_0291660 [Tanacetum coccineum]
MAAPRTTHSPPYTTLITFTPSSPPPPSLSSSSPLHPHRNHRTDTTTSTISFTPPPSRRHCYHRCLVTPPPPAGTKGACGLSAAPQGCVWFGLYFHLPGVSDLGGFHGSFVLGYDGIPLQPVAPTPPELHTRSGDIYRYYRSHDEDERDCAYAEEQPLPPIDSPTTDSPGYVTESDPEEDPEEYEDDKTEDGPVDYPMDGGDDGYDGDDDDGDSSGDDARDEDEDEEDEEDDGGTWRGGGAT